MVRQVREDWRRGFFRTYVTDYWNWLDWTSIFAGTLVLLTYWFQYIWLLNLEDMIKVLGPAPDEIPSESIPENTYKLVLWENLLYQERVMAIVNRLEDLIGVRGWECSQDHPRTPIRSSRLEDLIGVRV